MSRSNASRTKRVNISLTKQLAAYLELLAEQGVYGSNTSEVAKYFVQSGVIQALKDGALPKPSVEKHIK